MTINVTGGASTMQGADNTAASGDRGRIAAAWGQTGQNTRGSSQQARQQIAQQQANGGGVSAGGPAQGVVGGQFQHMQPNQMVTSYGLFGTPGQGQTQRPPAQQMPGQLPNHPAPGQPPMNMPQLPGQQLGGNINGQLGQGALMSGMSAQQPQTFTANRDTTGRTAGYAGAPAPSLQGAAAQPQNGGQQGGLGPIPSAPPPGGGHTMTGQSFPGGAQGAAIWQAIFGDGGAADTAGDVAGSVGGAVGGGLGQGIGDYIKAFNDATGGGQAANFNDFMQTPGFQQSSLVNDVGQQTSNMIDPAAWEQMAHNQLDQRGQANLASLNLGERRLNDRAGRTGLANTGGAMGSMYNNYANQQNQDQRDVYNDTLGHQMQAINSAQQYSLGNNAQDQARWGMLNSNQMQGAQANWAKMLQDNPSALGFLQDIMGGAGSAAGMVPQAGGALMSMLGPLAMLAAG